MHLKSWSSVAGLASLFLLSACEETDTLEPLCRKSVVEIQFEPPLTEVGKYEFSLKDKEDQGSCRVDLLKGEGSKFSCTTDLWYVDLSASEGQTEEDAGENIVGLTLYDAEDLNRLTLVVAREDELLFEEELSLQKEEEANRCGHTTVRGKTTVKWKE